MAASPAPNNAVAGSDEKGPTTAPAGGGSLRAIVRVLMAVAAVSVPTLLLVRFDGHPMSQVWIISLSVCSYVFLYLLCIWRSRWWYDELARHSYGPLLAFFSASAIGPATATFVLFFSAVWAAGNFGYSLAVHRLRKGTEPAIHALPVPSCPTKDTLEDLIFNLHALVPFGVLLWTLFMALFVYVLTLGMDEQDNTATGVCELLILMTISYFGWIPVALWVFFVALGPMQGVLIGEWMKWLLPALLPWMVFSNLIGLLLSPILSVLCHFLLMVALVAYLWYNLAIYIHYLETATPSTTTPRNEDTLQSEIQQDNIGHVKYDPTLGETPTQTAATLVDPLQNSIDEEPVIMAGGKKHGSCMIVDGRIDPATSLSQISAISTSESSGVQPDHGQRATTMITDLQAQLEEERRQRLEEREAFQRRLEDERIQRLETEERQQADMREQFRAMYAKVFGQDLPLM